MSRCLCTAFLLLFCCLTPSLFAQPSLDETDTDTVTVELKGGEKLAFQVYRDGRRRDQFYYMPDTVRLFENTVNGKQIPQFTLLRFDFTDQDNPTAPTGGILQFAAMMGATPEALEQIKKKIPEAFKLEKNDPVQLASIPVKQAKVALYAGKDGKLVTAAFGEGVAPLSDTQRMVFQMDLSQAGADVYDALTKQGQGGVGVAVTVDFLGLTPPAEVKITANYRLIADHYSKNEKTKIAAAASGWFGAVKANAEYRKEFQEARDALEKCGALKVDVYGSEKFPSDKLNEMFVAPVLARINQQILEVQKNPEKTVPASAPDPKAEASAKGWGIAAAYGKSVAVKKASEVRDYTETIDLKFRDVVPRQSLVAGFIGVGNYDEKIKEQLYIKATRQFPTAILKLPVLGDDYFQTASFRSWVTGPDGNGEFYSNVHQWKRGADGWKTGKDVAANYAQFGFTTLPEGISGKDWTKFKLHYHFKATTATSQQLERKGEIAALYGTAEATGVDGTSHAVVEIDWNALPWATSNKDQKQGDVINVAVLAKQGNADLVRATARPVDAKGAFMLPPTTRIYCPVEKGPVSLEMTMIVIEDGKSTRKKWKSSEDIRNAVSVTPLAVDFK